MKEKNTSNVVLTDDERSELAELRAKAYIREHHDIESEQACDYIWFRSSQSAQQNGLPINEAVDMVLEQHPEYKHFRYTRDEKPHVYVDPTPPPESTLDILAERDYARRYEMGRRLFGDTKKANEK